MKRNWKKAVVSVLAALLCAALLPGGGAYAMTAGGIRGTAGYDAKKGDTYEDAGYYVLTSMTEGGETMEEELEMLRAFGMQAYLVLEDGGEGFIFLFDELEDFSWADGRIIVEDESLPYTIKDGVLILESEEDDEVMRMEFTKSSDPAPTREEALKAAEAAGYEFDEDDEDEDLDLDDLDLDSEDLKELEEAAGGRSSSDGNVIVVSTAEELMDALGTGRTVILEPGTYNITEYIEDHELKEWDWEDYEEFEEEDDDEDEDGEDAAFAPGIYVGGVFDGAELIINDIDGLTLVSAYADEPAEIVCEPRYADVLSFVDCDRLTLDGIVMGHTKEQGSCAGDVLSLNYCYNVTVTNSELYGCGTYAFTMDDCNNITVTNSLIHDCSYGCAVVRDTAGLRFLRTAFEDCREFTMFELDDTDAAFIGCSFAALDGELISLTDKDSTAVFAACEFDRAAKKSLEDNAEFGGRITYFE